MFSRASGAMPSAMTNSPALGSPAISAAAKDCWSSRSVGMCALLRGAQRPRGNGGFVQQHAERGNIGVPFDQRGDRTEQRERVGIQAPDLIADARAVIVDADNAAVGQLLDAVAGEMNFTDGMVWKRCEIGVRIPAVIAATDVDIVHVAQ